MVGLVSFVYMFSFFVCTHPETTPYNTRQSIPSTHYPHSETTPYTTTQYITIDDTKHSLLVGRGHDHVERGLVGGHHHGLHHRLALLFIQ